MTLEVGGNRRDPWRGYRIGRGFKATLIIAITMLFLLIAGVAAMSAALELFDAV